MEAWQHVKLTGTNWPGDLIFKIIPQMAPADAQKLPKPPVYACPHLCAGAHGRGETPVSIPNTEVKTPSAYGTAGFPGGRVGQCRHSIVGVNIMMQPLCRGGEIGRHIRLKI